MTAPVPIIDSRSGFAAAIQWGFGRAVELGARRIVCVDRDFAIWSLDDAARLESLAAWLRLPQRRLVLLAAHFDEVPRRHPRFVTWRRHFAHAVATLAAPEDLVDALPTLLIDDKGTLVRLVDAVHWRGRASDDEATARPWRDEIDAVVQRSEPSFPTTTLGL